MFFIYSNLIMEKELQIIRLPRKYADILQILSLEEKWKILDSILYYNEKEIELNWTTKTLFELIKVDLDNLHKMASWWSRWWRPKKEKPMVIEKEKPRVEENQNQKKGKESKVKEIKTIYWKENKVKLTEEEYNKIKDRYWIDNVNKYINKLDLYILQQWKDKYSSHYAVILNWMSKDDLKEIKETKSFNIDYLLS